MELRTSVYLNEYRGGIVISVIMKTGTRLRCRFIVLFKQVPVVVGTYEFGSNIGYQRGNIAHLLLKEQSASNGKDDFKTSLSLLEQISKLLIS
ncbi:hypothetical protein QFZ80_002965 [Paenibacillus sp. V4I7]|nr:hypothetical protein [Paenibacillus sp. V4I7]